MSTLKPIKVRKSRIDSTNYLISPNRPLGTPLIIDVHESLIDGLTCPRPESSQDVKWLCTTLPELGFSTTPKVLSSRDTNSCLHSKDKFFATLKSMAQKPEMTIQADVFVCIILAFGGPGFFYLTDGYKVQLSDVIDIFKADYCCGLVCKPKVFIIHTDDHNLKKYDASQFGDQPGAPMPGKVPVEADILVYQSEISAKYSSYLADNEPDEYDELVRKSLAPAREANKGTHFIWMLIQSAKKLYSVGKFDMFQWIFQTNEMVDKYIKSEKWETWKTDQDKKWNCPPRIPTTTCQLTRNIVFYEKK